MEDVWVVISLLLFGSLLFCLCCYKVTNLLYMLYHIDDATESLTGNDITANTATVLSNATAGTLSALGVLPIALADGVGGGGGGQPGGGSPNGNQKLSVTATPPSRLRQPFPPPAYSHVNHRSTPSLYPLEKVGKANSVTSLSVGVQYDPRDVHMAGSNRVQGRYTAVEYIPADGLRGSTHRKTHLHVSAPDFRVGSYEMTRRSHNNNPRRHHDMLSTSTSLHHHHHHHHLHQQQRGKS